MLRLLIWGATQREREQSNEILRLHAELVDLRDKARQDALKAAEDLQQAYAGFMAFLRPGNPPSTSQTLPEPPRELPGDRPSTTPKYPEAPLWTKGEVEVASEHAVPV